MKKLLALLLAAMLLVPAFAMADNVVRIGVFEPSTGDNGAGGKQEILGIEYANSLAPTVTIGGEEYTVELVIEDNQSLKTVEICVELEVLAFPDETAANFMNRMTAVISQRKHHFIEALVDLAFCNQFLVFSRFLLRTEGIRHTA